MKPLRLESRLALGVFALFGLAAAVGVPPAVTYDGPSHYFRALQVSEGTWRAEQYSDRAVGGSLPAAHVAFVNSLWGSYWQRGDFGTLSSWGALSRKAAGTAGRSRAEFTNAAIYSPLNYAFQAAGMRLASALGGSPLAVSRLGCLLDLVGYALLVVAAVEVAPRYQRGIVLLATSPLIVIQAASLSPDAVNFALPLLLLSWCWRIRAGSGGPRAQLAWPLGLGLAVVLLKPNAAAALLCLGLLPAGRFGSRLSKAAWLSAYTLVAAALWYAWNGPILNVDVARWFEPDLPAVALQKAWFLGDPLRFLAPFGYMLEHDLAKQLPRLYCDVGGWIPAPLLHRLEAVSALLFIGLLGCGQWEGKTDWAWAVGSLLQALALLALLSLGLWIGLGVPPTLPEAGPGGRLELLSLTIPGLVGRYLFLTVIWAAVSFAEVFHGGFRRARAALFWACLLANCAGLAAILASIGSRVF